LLVVTFFDVGVVPAFPEEAAVVLVELNVVELNLGVSPLPGQTSVERCLVRHGLVTPQARKRKRKRSEYKRCERSRAMELWQMDIVGVVRLVDGSEGEDRVWDR